MFDIVIDRFFQAVERMNGQTLPLEAKLVLRRHKRVAKYIFQNMLTKFGQYWQDSDALVIAPCNCQLDCPVDL